MKARHIALTSVSETEKAQIRDELRSGDARDVGEKLGYSKVLIYKVIRGERHNDAVWAELQAKINLRKAYHRSDNQAASCATMSA